jgi:hypothetical protein
MPTKMTRTAIKERDVDAHVATHEDRHLTGQIQR